MVARGVARGDRYDGHADPLGPVVEAEPAREEPIAEGDVEEIAATRARRRQRTGHDLAPEVEIAGGIGGDGRLALGAGRRVDPRDVPARHRQEAERILLAKVGLADEREAREIRERADRGAAESLPVKRDMLDGPADGVLK